ncbi:MAG: DoxX subfamily, partial [Bacteroidales bacterium]|nr:DoxX subfamily [Bacteroidales bacterium]
MVLLGFYYLSHPPFLNLEYVLPSEGSYLIVNKTLIEMISLWVLWLFPTGRIMGIDRIIFGSREQNK